MMSSRPSPFLLLLLLSFTTVCMATPEGDTLQGLQQYWNVSFGRSWRGVRPCHHNWLGVTCDTIDGHVIGLNLSWSSTLVALGKPLPPSIGQLTNLRSLVLTNMSLTGTLTTGIGKLTKLTTLDLTGNSIVGPIPEEITLCTNLQVLSFRQNNLGGQLPAFLGKLTKLVKLDLHKNSMWGGLPPEWGTMTAMQSMQLWENDLSGHIPDSWRNMTSMVNFGMGQLFLSGPVPDWFFHFPNMTTFNIPRNQFMGDFPTNIPHNSSNYSQFKESQMECNYFTGPYPTNVPKPILFHNNCYIGQVDGDPAHDPGTTEYTQQNCKRTLSCPQFYKLVNQSSNGTSTSLDSQPDYGPKCCPIAIDDCRLRSCGCAPCPNAQVLVDPSTCVCGKEVGSRKVLSIGAVVGGVGGGVVAILLAVLCLLLYKQRLDAQKNKYSLFGRQFEGINDPWEVPKEIKRFTLEELEKATMEFSDANCIGHGGFGHVYRGTLEDGKVVAIKCASLDSTQGQAEFRNELKLLSRLHHRNLVVLEGFCDDNGYQILVYEYLVNGNLHTNLSETKEEKSAVSPYLNAYQRLEVAVGIARGIEYLHSFADPPVIHRDLKPSNILLDEEMTAKIADFGISRVSAGRTHVSTRALGTAGYQDPEYFTRLQLTTASDVYAFGIILLELITGQQAIDYNRAADELNLLEWVKRRYPSGGISAILDPRLGGADDADMYKAMTDIALQCSMYDRISRPTMKVVLSTLEPFIKVEPPRRALSFAWSREHSFDMAESGFIVDLKGSNTEDLTTTSGSPPVDDSLRRISSDEARNQIDSRDRNPLEPR